MLGKNWTMRTKLTVSFGCVAFVTLVAATLAIVSLGTARNQFTGYVEGINVRTMTAQALLAAVDKRAIAARNLVLVNTESDKTLENRAVQTSHAKVNELLKKIESMSLAADDETAQGKALIEKFKSIEALYGPVALNIVNLANQGNNEASIASMNNDCRPLLAQWVAAVNDYVAYAEANSAASMQASSAGYETQRALLIAACALAIGVALASGVLITRDLSRSLGAEPSALSDVAKNVSEGDLQPVVGGDLAPAGSVMASLNAMQQSLSSLVSQVRTASDSIAVGSSQVAAGSLDLSQRTEQQASNLQETAASMEQLTSTVKNNADTASQADTLANSASTAAAKGGEVVGQVVVTMQDIAASSKKISDIIGVIDGIAFQTNILALNAAVEAARAGEQGRGFAVVAGEVRTLAQRSATAAKEIKALIVDSVAKVEVGTRQVHDAGESMSAIVSQVKNVSGLIGEISRATVEQSNGIGQVSGAVNELDQVTQQNAALVEQSTAAADSLRQQADRLLSLMSTFKLSGNQNDHFKTKPATSSSSNEQVLKKPVMAKKAEPKPAVAATATPAPVAAGKAAHFPEPKPVSKPAPPSSSSADDGDWDTF